MNEKERLIDKAFSLVCRLFDAIDPITRKEKKQLKNKKLKKKRNKFKYMKNNQLIIRS